MTFCTRFAFLIFLLMAALLSGCGDDKEDSIDWQLPLTVPPDPHGAKISNELPEWASQRGVNAMLVFLNKSQALTTEMPITLGHTELIADLEVTLSGSAGGLRIKSGAYIDDPDVDNPAVYVEVNTKTGELLYKGWLYKEFPELFGPDLADWKIWVTDIQNRSQ